ncbi:MFS transporter [Corynebacterium comes]|uniref:Major Facilitator Superfamily protein n=1 Tax=Corynebacterium comes TaxID=2675218 RepID=A0A6B8VJ18_9CORY|nr:MFS transporter [Corynebacterium comes]QGU04093.1 Major Facilitator Superfamily protein [Corynebacterium comes]
MKQKLQLGAILVGGFVGPFTGQALAVVVPEFAATFDVSVARAAATMTVYLFPFAAMMLISGRLVRRFQPHRVVSAAYAVTLPMALLLLVTPSWGLFAAAYATIGVANAFTTPVLQNLLRAITPPEKLGQALGTYAAMQSLGMLSAPLVSGLSSLITWRLTFLVTAAAAAYILIVRLPVVPPPAQADDTTAGRVRVVPTLTHMVTSFVVGCGVIGLGFMTSLHVGEVFDLGPVGRGLVIMAGGAAAFLASRKIGAMADRYGVTTVLVVSGLMAALALFILPVAPWVVLVALVWAVAVMAAQGMQATINLAIIQGPAGSSLISTVQAFRFFGSAAAPVLFLPIYVGIGGAAFWVAALALAAAAAAQWGLGRAESPRVS